jgi:hypothetical protein
VNEAPDFLEPFEAWRVWRVVRRDDEYVLASVMYPTVWRPGEPLVAECLARRLWRPFRRRDAHAAPDAGCQCGIYGAAIEGAREYFKGISPDGSVRVLGRVSLWGTVIECTRGFRASHAHPSRVFLPGDFGSRGRVDWNRLVAGLSRYGVPVEPLSAAAEAVRREAEPQAPA